MIRLATFEDLSAIKKIANQNRQFIGFIMKISLIESISNKTLFVFEENKIISGFVNYYSRKDGWNTLHEIAILKEFQNKGIGQKLFNIVPLPIRLKTTADNVNALSFYSKNHMKIIRTEIGRKRELIVLEKIDK